MIEKSFFKDEGSLLKRDWKNYEGAGARRLGRVIHHLVMHE